MPFALGMPTLLEIPDLPRTTTVCQRLGLHVVEINANMPQYCPETLRATDIVNLTRQTGIVYTLHLPEEVDLGTFHPAMRTGYLQCCRELIVWAAAAGITLVNMHLHTGVYFTLPDRKAWIYAEHQESFLANVLTGMTELAAVARQHDIALCIENCGNFHLPFINKAIIQLLREEGVYLTWDTGHDASAEYREAPILSSHASQIRHMHLHDANGPNNHLPLYTGTVPIDDRLAFARTQDVTVIIEVKTLDALTESVRTLQQRNLHH